MTGKKVRLIFDGYSVLNCIPDSIFYTFNVNDNKLRIVAEEDSKLYNLLKDYTIKIEEMGDDMI